MYLSNRLPMANYDFKGRKNHTVKVSRSINAKNHRLVDHRLQRVEGGSNHEETG